MGRKMGSLALLALLVIGPACASGQQAEGGSAPGGGSPPPEASGPRSGGSSSGRGPGPEAESTAASVLDGVYTAAQASRGEDTFQRVCVTCHQSSEFRGGRFRLSWTGATVADLYDLVSTTMPQANPGSLSPREYAAIISYVLSLNDYPTGEEELPADPDVLERVRIEPAAD